MENNDEKVKTGKKIINNQKLISQKENDRIRLVNKISRN